MLWPEHRVHPRGRHPPRDEAAPGGFVPAPARLLWAAWSRPGCRSPGCFVTTEQERRRLMVTVQLASSASWEHHAGLLRKALRVTHIYTHIHICIHTYMCVYTHTHTCGNFKHYAQKAHAALSWELFSITFQSVYIPDRLICFTSLWNPWNAVVCFRWVGWHFIWKIYQEIGQWKSRRMGQTKVKESGKLWGLFPQVHKLSVTYKNAKYVKIHRELTSLQSLSKARFVLH